MATWQYNVITFNSEYETLADSVVLESVTGITLSGVAASRGIIQRRLQMEGSEGWELVALIPAHPSTSPPDLQDISVANPWMYHAIFKRPKD